MGKKAPPKWLWWLHKHERKKAKFARLRRKHGDLCWRCQKPMRFDGDRTHDRAATIEHLNPKALGGTLAFANLRLCHRGCNRHLGAWPAEHKERMRINLPRRA